MTKERKRQSIKKNNLNWRNIFRVCVNKMKKQGKRLKKGKERNAKKEKKSNSQEKNCIILDLLLYIYIYIYI